MKISINGRNTLILGMSFLAAFVLMAFATWLAVIFEKDSADENVAVQEQVLQEDAEHLAAIQYLERLAKSYGAEEEETLSIDFYGEGNFEELARRFFCPDDKTICEAMESGKLNLDDLENLLTDIGPQGDPCSLENVPHIELEDGSFKILYWSDCDQQ